MRKLIFAAPLALLQAVLAQAIFCLRHCNIKVKFGLKGELLSRSCQNSMNMLAGMLLQSVNTSLFV